MILIVDDRPENIFSLRSILELHSFPVDTASSGEEALKKAIRTDYSLIILDVQMPDMDGFEVAEYLSGNNSTSDIPIIFLSAVNTEKKFITRGYSSGAIDYIVKPIDPDILLLKVKTFHRLYEQNRELNRVQQSLQSEIEFRKKAQAQIQEKAKELNGILASIPQVAFTATSAGQIDFVNEHWYAYANSFREFPKVHADDPPIEQAWQATLARNEPAEMELRIARTGTEDFRYHLLRVVPVTENGHTQKWVGTFTDIEEQKLAIRRKDEFLSIASHELKTPLTSIKAYVQLVNQLLPSENPAKEFMDRTMVQVNKLDTLINDLLDISKIENGKLRFDLQPTEFGGLLRATLEMLQQIHPGIAITQMGDCHAVINANAVRLEQVIINFISNAIKYAPSSKIEVITRIDDGDNLYFGVRDHGIGISPEDQENIFGKFYRVSDSARNVQGLGIGLYICAEILRRHHASFGVESKSGEGSLFYFSIPLYVPNPHQPPTALT
ncbi:MAG: response regulator [Bacteroidota bacterium]|nr:response regulator [Bacteroidota bacterium]